MIYPIEIILGWMLEFFLEEYKPIKSEIDINQCQVNKYLVIYTNVCLKVVFLISMMYLLISSSSSGFKARITFKSPILRSAKPS